MKKLLSALLVVCIGFTMTACSSSGSKDKKEDPAKEEVIKKDVYAINETIEMKDCKFTVTSAYTSQGEGYYKPDDGKVFVVSDVTIENTTDKEISFNTLNFSMQNGAGVIESLGFETFASDSQIGSGKLTPGGEVSGLVISEQPANALDGLVLIYKPGTFSDEQGKVALTF